jgi:hypothetical protein
MASELCPNCGSADVNPPDEGFWADCNDCGFIQYDEATLRLQAEVKREQKTAKDIFGRVPSYAEWTEYQKADKIRQMQLEEEMRNDR